MSQPQITFAPNQKINQMQSVKIESFNIVGIAVKTTNQNGQAAKDIPALWTKFISENSVSKIPNKIDPTIYSLYTDYVSDYTEPYTTILGCKVENLDNIPDGMIGKTFEGGEFVKFTTKGDLEKDLIINEWQKIWAKDLDRKYTVDFEVYGEKAQNMKDAEVDILISVN